MRYLLPLLLSTLLCTCDSAPNTSTLNTEPEPTYDSPADSLLHRAVTAAGLTVLDSAAYTFRFRQHRYRYQNDRGRFTYERWISDTITGAVTRDVLTNDGLTRYVDGRPVTLTGKQDSAYASSVNSVIYFAFLPYALQAPAANLDYRGRREILGDSLHEIAVSFGREGGGNDFEDSFRYWFEPGTNALRYLAYVEKDNKFPRFRRAVNARRVEGLLLVDYINYHTPGNTPTPVDSLADAFNRGDLPELSRINTEELRRAPVTADRNDGRAALN